MMVRVMLMVMVMAMLVHWVRVHGQAMQQHQEEQAREAAEARCCMC